MVCGQVWWPILGICPLHLTHPSAHSQQWTHTWSSGQPYCGARGAVGGSVPCSRVSPQSWYWRWREHLLFTPPTDNPCRTWESNRQPLGYKSNSLTIRPRLPLKFSAFNPSWVNTPGAVGSHATAPGEQLGVRCLLKAAQSWYWGWREHLLFTPSAYNPCRTGDSNPQPLDYKSDALTIRPRIKRFILKRQSDRGSARNTKSQSLFE